VVEKAHSTGRRRPGKTSRVFAAGQRFRRDGDFSSTFGPIDSCGLLSSTRPAGWEFRSTSWTRLDTSQHCPVCGHVDRRNRNGRSEFVYRLCGFSHHAHRVAAVNIAARAAVNPPVVERHHSLYVATCVATASRQLQLTVLDTSQESGRR
jgi:hypothetical protein